MTGQAILSETGDTSIRFLVGIVWPPGIRVIRAMLIDLLWWQIQAVLEELTDILLEHKLKFFRHRVKLVLMLNERFDRLDRYETVVSHRVRPF